MTVVHYLNQFFAGLGGEEAADTEPFRIDGPVGPGNALAAAGITPDITIGCGDDYFGQHEAEALRSLLGWIGELRPGRPGLRSVVRIGPLRIRVRRGGSGGRPTGHPGRRGDDPRFARRARERGRRLHRAHGLERREHADRVAHDRVAGDRLAAGETGREVPTKRDISREGSAQTCMPARTGAARAVDLVLSKLEGAVRDRDRAARPRGPGAAAHRRRGDGDRGARDRGGLRARRAIRIVCRPVTRTCGCGTRSGCGSMSADRYETVHAGFDTAVANRIRTGWFPWTPARELEANGKIGHLARHVLHDLRRGYAGRDRGEVRTGDRRRASRSEDRGGDPHRHLRHRNALRGNALSGVRTRGDPDCLHHSAADDRADGGREPDPARRLDHAPDGRSRPSRSARSTSFACGCRAGARDARGDVGSRTVWELT